MPVCHGVIWVYGNGDWRYFGQNADGSYSNPPEDFGTLVENGDGSWTYTARDQTVTNFDYFGCQTSVVDPHGLATVYHYDVNHDLTEVDTIDGGVTTFNGSVFTEPGRRTWGLTFAGKDLVALTSPTGQVRTFTYLDDLLIEDDWDPLVSQFTFSQLGLLGILLRSGATHHVEAGLGSGRWAPEMAAPSLQTPPAITHVRNAGVTW